MWSPICRRICRARISDPNPHAYFSHPACCRILKRLEDSIVWRAWHIYVDTFQHLEELLLRAIMPEVKALDPPCDAFFIRYGENGPHVRFRLRGLDVSAFEAMGGRLHTTALQIVSGSGKPPESSNISLYLSHNAIAPFKPGSTVEVPYEPEIQRYGGEHAISINEHLFAASSRLALSIIEATNKKNGARQNIALGLTAAAISSINASREAHTAFLTTMKNYWSSFLRDPKVVEDIVRRDYAVAGTSIRRVALQFSNPSRATLSSVELRWKANVCRHFVALDALGTENLLIHPLTGRVAIGRDDVDNALLSILLSQIHMMNNRLGILPHEEFYFASILLMALAEM